jgi:hypothetical protein
MTAPAVPTFGAAGSVIIVAGTALLRQQDIDSATAASRSGAMTPDCIRPGWAVHLQTSVSRNDGPVRRLKR